LDRITINLLLDSNILIWFTLTPDRLSAKVTQLIADKNNNLFISIASIWEIQIKLQLQKLTLNLPLSTLVKDLQQNSDIQILDITLAHIYALENLPNEHRDPFDRIMIAQAMVEKMPFLSADKVFDLYRIERVW
jgi:PIN domain nuclease of toxin-antitoxin system